MKRRHFLSVSTAIAGSVLLTQCRQSSKSSPSHDVPSHDAQKTAPASNQSASNQSASNTVYTSTNGLLDLDLEASYRTLELNGKQATLMAYNGQVPGPRLEANPGDTVRIRFTNNLPDPTNIHYHGLNISHSGNADNVFLSVEPGETFAYEFTIPKDHPAGTFWYHPHRHGFVADQVFAGLSGFFVVRGDLDEIPAIKSASETFLALKDFQLDEEGNLASADRMAVMMGREGSLVTANAQINPNLSIPTNGLLRLRLLNASISRFYRLQLEGHSMSLIATDGGALSEPVEVKELMLVPGERAEVLIRGDQASGSYRLLNLPYNRGGMGMMHGGMGGGMGDMNMSQGDSMEGMHMESAGTEAPDEPATKILPLATLVYDSEAYDSEAYDSEAYGGDESLTTTVLPSQLIPVLPLPATQNTRRIELSMRMSFLRGMAFTLNDKTFDENRVDIQVPLNTVEEWEIANVDADMMDHPFHLHAASFQVISRNGQLEPYLAWKDTVLVRGGETLRIRMRFKDFAGKSVYHCHVLDHEELGMMGVIDVQA
ncbi:MAG: multicopper oxidase family protein [Phormidesmis sp.]